VQVYQGGYPQQQPAAYPQQQALARQQQAAGPPAVAPQQGGELQKMAGKNPKGSALALAGAGVAMLVLPLLILPALGVGMGLYVLPAVFSLLPFGGAAWLLKRGVKPPEALSPAREQQLLELAMRTGGALTVTATAHNLRIPLEEAEAALMDLARKGHVEIDNDEDTGAVIYVFPEIKPTPALPGRTS
jgi:hypothetical protein